MHESIQPELLNHHRHFTSSVVASSFADRAVLISRNLEGSVIARALTTRTSAAEDGYYQPGSFDF